MNARNGFFNLKKLAATFVFVLLAAQLSFPAEGTETNAAVKLNKAQTVSIVVKELSRKLQSDLVSKSVSIKLGSTESYAVSKNQIGLKGEGTCRLDGETAELPVYFDVKIDVARRAAIDVRYVFLNAEGVTPESKPAALSAEDIVTGKLLSRLKEDYKTENVVVALDQVSEQTLANGEKGYTGVGEVRLDGMIWKKFSFEIAGDKSSLQNASAKATGVKYRIK